MTRSASRHVPDLRPWIASWGAAWSVPDLASRTRLTFSGRMSRSLGRCALRTGVIRLNAKLLDGPEAALLEVVCHEAAHAAVFILHGPKARPHGREWKTLMRAAGYEPVVRWPEHWGESPFSRRSGIRGASREKGDSPQSPFQRLLRLFR